MAKTKTTAFFCSECGYESPKWMGQCPACRAWGTMVEAPKKERETRMEGFGGSREPEPVTLSQIDAAQEPRIPTGFRELDGVLGGGIVPASLILVGGDPGIGKSTLLLQVARNVSAGGKSVLYISGEESLHQIRLRAARMGDFTENVRFLCETDLDAVEGILRRMEPAVVVIDSIQTMVCRDLDRVPGSPGQVREATNVLLQLAKGLGTAIFIVGHVTKEGTVAGPRMLEHMVDTVLYFEGEHSASYRVIRAAKNRFGSTNEIGVFDMESDGLHEVKNPSEYLLNGRPLGTSGSVVACAMEGTRPVLLEIQALICQSNFGTPRRTAAGVDYNRVNLLMAVLEKRLGVRLSDCDAYVNIAGGLHLTEPALDLGIVLAIYSSRRDVAVGDRTVAFGEVGLAGEVRGVSQAERRVSEAKKLGFDTCILPRSTAERIGEAKGIRLIGVRNVAEAVAVL